MKKRLNIYPCGFKWRQNPFTLTGVLFKITNKLTGFKIALLQFTIDLEKAIIKDIVIFSGGNPDLVDRKL